MAEIRIAVYGYVSSGKTTTVNALFGEQYGEVSMQSTTSCVNFYRIVPTTTAKPTKKRNAPTQATNQTENATVALVADSDEDSKPNKTEGETICEAKTLLQQSIADNKIFRDSDVVQEKFHNVQLRENLHEKMRDNVSLVVVDIPGINEAGTSSKYKDYVNNKWHSFDAVISVMDARQGANTDEQHLLLDLAKCNLKKKDIPVVIVCNKVDDPSDKEQSALLDQVRATVERLFGVVDRKAAMETLRSSKMTGKFDSTLFPAVVHLSAMNAFLYRSVARLQKSDFLKLDVEYIEKIGKDSWGRKWRGFSDLEKPEKAWETVQNSEECDEALQQSNFGSLMKVLGYCIGDMKRQGYMIGKQADVAVQRITELAPGCDPVAELVTAFYSLKAVDKKVNHLSGKFWKAYRSVSDNALSAFAASFDPAAMAPAIQLLVDYNRALHKLDAGHEKPMVAKEARSLVNAYVLTVIESGHFGGKSWRDKAMIRFSLSICFNFEVFCLNFGNLKFHLDLFFDLQKEEEEDLIRLPVAQGTRDCPYCHETTVHGTSTTKAPSTRKRHATEGENANTLTVKKRDVDGAKVLACSLCNEEFIVGHVSKEGEFVLKWPPTFPLKIANGELVPKDSAWYAAQGSLVIPDSLEDTNHFGHVIWKCCQLLKELES